MKEKKWKIKKNENYKKNEKLKKREWKIKIKNENLKTNEKLKLKMKKKLKIKKKSGNKNVFANQYIKKQDDIFLLGMARPKFSTKKFEKTYSWKTKKMWSKKNCGRKKNRGWKNGCLSRVLTWLLKLFFMVKIDSLADLGRNWRHRVRFPNYQQKMEAKLKTKFN